MATDKSETLGRRRFLAATMGTALLAEGLVSRSTYAEEKKSKVQAKASDSPSAKKVELLFLGTGAADWPSKYPPSEKQVERGEVRGMSSMLVNGHILIDCGPTVLDAMNRYKVNPVGITDIFFPIHTRTTFTKIHYLP